MIIKGFKYTRYPGRPREWKVVGKDGGLNEDYAYFDNLNLLIGKNAAGKSRTLEAIKEISKLISGRQLVKDTKYHTQHYDFLFKENEEMYRYVLSFVEKEITEEQLYINDVLVLDRADTFIVRLGEKVNMSGKFDNEELLVNKKNGEEYYFQKLVYWAWSLREFMFADQAEKNRYIEDLNKIPEEHWRTDNLGIVIPIFYHARKRYGQKFEDEILECMNELGYKLSDIDIKKNSRGYCINVEEDGKYQVSQQEMSQGMFRALALFVILISARWSKLSVCILVDDIGEGLDHERSKGFVDLVIKKTFNTEIQYFMSTNDRYIMNQIHLKYWSVIERQGSKSVVYNTANSKSVFDDFKFTGLNNFDFFTTDFYRDGFGDENEEVEE